MTTSALVRLVIFNGVVEVCFQFSLLLLWCAGLVPIIRDMLVLSVLRVFAFFPPRYLLKIRLKKFFTFAPRTKVFSSMEFRD